MIKFHQLLFTLLLLLVQVQTIQSSFLLLLSSSSPTNSKLLQQTFKRNSYSKDDDDNDLSSSIEEEFSYSRRRRDFVFRTMNVLSFLSAADCAQALVSKTPTFTSSSNNNNLYSSTNTISYSNVAKSTTEDTAAADFLESVYYTTSQILTPPLDNRQYKAFVLENNSLRVLLVSDPGSNVGAVAMDVHVGATSDYERVKGIAHFNEHMLFLGTKEYPDEDQFEAFLTANGGSSNAFTSSEDTVYYFDVNTGATENFESALDRFGSFFTSPLFTESATARELNAIDSEHAKNLQSDSFRFYQIEKERVNRNHPFSKFFTGTRVTLLDETQKQGIELREQLLKFYTTYYSANQMTLAVVGPQPLPILENWVRKSFCKIPNLNIERPENKWAFKVPPYVNNRNGSVIASFKYAVEIVPVSDSRSVAMSFPLLFKNADEVQEFTLQKPEEFVSHLIGHEGKGSLLSFLKSKGWANGLGSSVVSELSDFRTLDINISLTNLGLKQVDSVVAAVFSYLQMLRVENIPNYVFNEVLQVTELEWRFLEKGSASNYVQSLAESMHKFEPPLYVAGPRRVSMEHILDSSSPMTAAAPRLQFSSMEERNSIQRLVKKLISQLTVDNMLLTVVSKSFAGKTNKKEEWYGTDYRVREIKSKTLQSWENCEEYSKLGMFYPRPNVFIPSERGLTVKKRVNRDLLIQANTFENRMKNPPTVPQLIRKDDDEKWTVYWKQDDRFGLPKAYVIVELITPLTYSSAENVVLGQLFQICAADSLTEYTYDATLAGLTYNLQVLPRGVRLTFGGYNEKLVNFAEYVSLKLTRDFMDVLPQTPEEFERFKDSLSRGLASFDVKQPYAHAIHYTTLLLEPQRFQYDNSALRAVLPNITLEKLQSYASKLWSLGKAEGLIQGNLTQDEALYIVDILDQALNFQTIALENVPKRIKALPVPLVRSNNYRHATKIRISEPNQSNNNSVSQITIQNLGTSDKDHVLMELLSSEIAEPFYEDLRTKQQLGYIVSSGVKVLEETRSLSLVSQSSVATAETLTDATFNFLSTFRQKYLEPLKDSDVYTAAKALLLKKTEPDKQLVSEITRNWAEIIGRSSDDGNPQFNRPQKEAATLLDITKEDLLHFWDEHFSFENNDSSGNSPSGMRIVVTEVVPGFGKASSTKPLKSYYSNKVNSKSNLPIDTEAGDLLLGIDDIQRYRLAREEWRNRSEGSNIDGEEFEPAL